MPAFCPSPGFGEGARDVADEDEEESELEESELEESESELEELALFFAFLPDGIVTELGKKFLCQKNGTGKSAPLPDGRRLHLTEGR